MFYEQFWRHFRFPLKCVCSVIIQSFLSFFPSKMMVVHTGRCRAARSVFYCMFSLTHQQLLLYFQTPRKFSLPCSSHVLPGVFLQVLSLISVRYWLPIWILFIIFLKSSVYIFISGFSWNGCNNAFILFLNWDLCIVFLLLCSFLRTRLMVNIFLELVVTVALAASNANIVVWTKQPKSRHYKPCNVSRDNNNEWYSKVRNGIRTNTYKFLTCFLLIFRLQRLNDKRSVTSFWHKSTHYSFQANVDGHIFYITFITMRVPLKRGHISYVII